MDRLIIIALLFLSPKVFAIDFACGPWLHEGASLKVEPALGRICVSGGSAEDPEFCNNTFATVYPITETRTGSVVMGSSQVEYTEFIVTLEENFMSLKVFAPSHLLFDAYEVHAAEIFSTIYGQSLAKDPDLTPQESDFVCRDIQD